MVRSTWYDDEPGYFQADASLGQHFSMVKLLLIINAAVFVVDYLVAYAGYGGIFRSVLGLDCNLIRSAYFPLLLLQLITYQFLHAGFLHILINMLILWFFGKDLDRVLGHRRFLILYLASGVMGGVLQIVFALAMGGEDLPRVVGASGAVFGLLIYYALTWPNRTVMMFPIFVPIKVKTLALIFVGIAVLYGFFPHQGDMTSHMCHLGGAVFGFLYFRYEVRFASLTKTVKSIKIQKDVQKKVDQEKEIDRLLDKIHAEGINALTDKERKFLHDASQGYRKR